jgi:hypothetical protein
MKKFLAIAVLATVMVACNNDSDTDSATADSIRIADSTRRADSLAAAQMRDTTTVKMDTTVTVPDTLKK